MQSMRPVIRGWTMALCAAGHALVACESPVPVTTDLCGGHGEFASEIGIGSRGGYDLVFVIEAGLAERVSSWVEAVVRQLVTGDADSDRRQDHHAEPFLRVAVLLPDEVPALLAFQQCSAQPGVACSSTELAHAAYRYRPYGYGDDPDAFLESVRCRLANVGRASACPPAPEPESVRESRPFAQTWADVVVVTDRDLCAAGDATCAEDPLRALLAGQRAIRVNWVAGVPADLLNDEGQRRLEIDRSDYLMQLASDPRLADDAAPLDCAGGEAEPARRLLQALSSDEDDGSLLSLCALDARALIDRTYFTCGGFADASPLFYGIDDVRFAADGRARCDLLEILPADGPITRCEQLLDFGRSTVDDVAQDEGRETCRLEQLVIDGGAPPSGYGFFYTPGPTESPAGRMPARSDFLPPCFGVIDGPAARFELTAETEAITDSTLLLRCELTHGGDAGCD